jgi:hypothetical protein
MRQLILSSLCFFLLIQPGYTQVGLFVRPDSSSLSAPVSGQTWLFNSTNKTMQVYNGSIFQVASAPLNNFVASVAPTSSNDNTQGYTPGSAWYNTVTGFTYQLVNAATSAAVWVQTNNLGALSIPLTSLQAGGASVGQSLLFNGTHWAPGSPAINLNQLVNSGALVSQVPVWNGTNWVPQTLSGGGGGGGLPVGGSDNKILSYASSTAGWFNGLSTVSSLTVNTGATLTVNSPSVIVVAPSGSDQVLYLPVASTCLGQMFTIVQSYTFSLYETTIETQGSDHIELFNGLSGTPFGGQLVIGGNGHGIPYSAPVTVISDGINCWHQLAPSQQPYAPAPLALNVVAQSSDFNAHTQEVDLVTLTSANVTATLPDATLYPGQQLVVILNQGSSSSYSLLFATTAGQLINASNFWYNQGFSGGTQAIVFTFISNGTNWNASFSGDMLAGLFNGPNNGYQTGQIAMSTNGNTIQLQSILSAHSVSSDTLAYSMNSYFVDTSGGDVVITLADAVAESGQEISVTYAVAGNNVKFASTSSQTINGGAATFFTYLTVVGSSVRFVSDGSNWWCVANTFGGVGP